MDSSTIETTLAAGEATAATNSDVKQGSEAPSTQSTEGQKPTGSMLDAVTSALKPKTDGEGSPTSQTKDSTGTDPEAKTEELPDEVSEDELKDQKPKTRKRIEQLLGKVKGLSAEADTLRPKAQEFDKLTSFIAQNNLSKSDIDVAFDLAALAKNQPEKALERLIPIVQQLQRVVGDILPAELQERVRLGYISEQDARELNRNRQRAALATHKAQEAEQRSQEQQRQQQIDGIVQSVSGAISQWESAKKASDPDWHLKAERIDQLVRLAVYEKGYPQTKEAAVKMIDEIYDTVTKEVRRLVPKPAGVQPAVAGGSSPTTVAEPKSLLEAVRIGLNK